MTSTTPNVRTPEFPKHPHDGYQIREELPDGGYVIWTYNAEYNEWLIDVYAVQKQEYITTRQVMTTSDSVLKAGGDAILPTQEAVNNTIAAATEAVIKSSGRAADQIDFLQNSVGKGIWTRTEGIPDSEDYPGPGEFWADATDFGDCKVFKFNDSGVPGLTNPGTLQETRVGDYLTIQENSNNDFGQYIIKGMTTENVGKAGVIIRTFDVEVIRGVRAQGDAQPLSYCTVTTSRPMSVIVQDNEPVVSTRGILWYREVDDVLSISNFPTGMTGADGPQWTEINHESDGVSKDYVDTNFLPKAGGTMTGDIVMNGKKITGLGSATQGGMAVSRNYGDDRYLQVAAGGQITGYVQFKDDTKLQMGGTYNNNIIDGKEGFTDNSIVATLGFVNHQIAQIGDSVGGSGRVPGVANYVWAEGRTFTNLLPGEISGFKADYEQTSFLSEIKYLAWNGVDKDGNRPSPDLNAIDFNSWCSTLQLMNPELTSTFIRSVGGSHLGKDFNVFQYSKEVDVYFVGWENSETTVLTSTMVRFLPAQVLALRMPDWFV